MNKNEIIGQIYILTEEETQAAKDAIERNLDSIADALLEQNVNKEDFTDLLQQELERYTEYINADADLAECEAEDEEMLEAGLKYTD